jgi:hypothetical protein
MSSVTQQHQPAFPYFLHSPPRPPHTPPAPSNLVIENPRQYRSSFHPNMTRLGFPMNANDNTSTCEVIAVPPNARAKLQRIQIRVAAKPQQFNSILCQLQRSLGRLRVELDVAAARAAVSTQWNRFAGLVLDASEKASRDRFAGCPTRLQHRTVREIRNVTTVHRLLALRTARMKVSHTQYSTEKTVCARPNYYSAALHLVHLEIGRGGLKSPFTDIGNFKHVLRSMILSV